MTRIVIAEGKTKQIIHIDAVRVQSKDDITAGDGAKHDILENKSEISTRTTSNVFRALKRYGVPVAFYAQDTPTSFIAPNCRMLPWEVVVRGKAYGSYLKRHPDLTKGQSFPGGELITEFFLKTSGRKWHEYDLPCDDPLATIMPHSMEIYLHEPDKEMYFPSPVHFLALQPYEVFELPSDARLIDRMRSIAQRTFIVLRAFWKLLGIELVDIKVEFGIDSNGNLLLADVIDNDSWRLVAEGKHLDKQLYREGATLEEVLSSFKRIADATDTFVTYHPDFG